MTPRPTPHKSVSEYDRVSPVRRQLFEVAYALRAMNYPQAAEKAEALSDEILDSARETDRRVGRL